MIGHIACRRLDIDPDKPETIRNAVLKVINDNCDGTYNGLTESSTLCVDNPISFAEEIIDAVSEVIHKEKLRNFFKSENGKKILLKFEKGLHHFNGEPITLRVNMKKSRIAKQNIIIERGKD